MDDLDLLLRWMSLRGVGSWKGFKDACEWLLGDERHTTPASMMRTLESLGHVEMDWSRGHWTIAPTVLVALPGAGIHAVLAGRRGPQIEMLLDELDDGGLDVVVERSPQADAPTAVFIGAAAWQDLVEAARQLGVPFAARFAQTAAPTLGPIARPSDLDHHSLPAGSEWFDTAALRWRRDDEPALGLRRYQEFGTYRCFWNDGRGWGATGMDEGRFLELHRQLRNVLVYRRDGANGRLEVPRATPLPWFHSRVVTLCSGLTPAWDDGHVGFDNVPYEVACLIASSLGQDLRDPRAQAR